MQTGDRYPTQNYGDLVIGEYRNAKDVTVIFANTNFLTTARADHIRSGKVTDKSAPKPTDVRLKTSAQWVREFKVAHGDTYDYSKFCSAGAHRGSVILCKAHGAFTQSPSNHAKGHGCPLCGAVTQAAAKAKPVAKVVDEFEAVHGGRYDYSQFTPRNNRTPATITCKAHGPFKQRADDHGRGAGCPSCSNVGPSAPERAIADAFRERGFGVSTSDRSILDNGKELDIVIPSKMLAIEYNGLRYHGEKFGKDKKYHADKTKLANAAGYRLIHVWEDEYLANPAREIKFLLEQVQPRKKIGARQTKLVGVSKAVSDAFLNEHHVQGASAATIRHGMYHKGELVAVCTFIDRGAGKSYELTRYASTVSIIGGVAKCCSRLSKGVYTFCDLARHDGRSYLANGFRYAGAIPPDYKYTRNQRRYHKFGFRRKAIAKKLPDYYDANLTEREMMHNSPYDRIWDCGKSRYVYAKR